MRSLEGSYSFPKSKRIPQHSASCSTDIIFTVSYMQTCLRIFKPYNIKFTHFFVFALTIQTEKKIYRYH